LGGIALIFFRLDFAIAGAVLIAVAELRWWPGFINYAVSVFAVMNKRVIARVGFFRRASLVVTFTEIEGLEVIQGN